MFYNLFKKLHILQVRRHPSAYRPLTFINWIRRKIIGNGFIKLLG
jgi:hypothetical protein